MRLAAGVGNYWVAGASFVDADGSFGVTILIFGLPFILFVRILLDGTWNETFSGGFVISAYSRNEDFRILFHFI